MDDVETLTEQCVVRDRLPVIERTVTDRKETRIWTTDSTDDHR